MKKILLFWGSSRIFSDLFLKYFHFPHILYIIFPFCIGLFDMFSFTRTWSYIKMVIFIFTHELFLVQVVFAEWYRQEVDTQSKNRTQLRCLPNTGGCCRQGRHKNQRCFHFDAAQMTLKFPRWRLEWNSCRKEHENNYVNLFGHNVYYICRAYIT